MNLALKIRRRSTLSAIIDRFTYGFNFQTHISFLNVQLIDKQHFSKFTREDCFVNFDTTNPRKAKPVTLIRVCSKTKISRKSPQAAN